MTPQEMLELLRSHFGEFTRNFGVKSLALFGSASRDQLREDSDVDLLVEFEGPASFDGYFALKHYIEELLEREVDLATEKMIKPRFRKRIEDELLYVA